MFKDNKRYNTLNNYYKGLYGTKVCKISLDNNVKCPNIKNGNGCLYCTGDFNNGFKEKDLMEQFIEVKKIEENKWPNAKFIAYFQSGTNTAISVDVAKKIWEPFLDIPGVIGLTIATRPDYISDEMYNYLNDLNKICDLTIEVGLQSANDETLKLINRGHDVDTFINCVKKLESLKIKTVAHIINGLPNESKEDMLNTVKLLNDLHIDGIKIHMLYIIKNSDLEIYYKENPFHILTKDEYIDIVCDQLELLNDNIVIHRITGDPKKEELLTPAWLLKKFVVLNDIDKELVRRNTYQGKKKER